MSYSFNCRAANTAAVLNQVREELAKVVANQPSHSADSEHAFEATARFLSVLHDDPKRDCTATVSGWLSSSDGAVQSASVTVNVGYAARETAPAPVVEDRPPQAS